MPFFRTREVVLPRFKLEQNYDLIGNLKEMGLTNLFQDSGDFSAMTSEKVAMNWVSNINSAMILQKRHLQLIIATNYFKIMDTFSFLSAAEAPRNHHCEWRGDRSCCSDPGGLHAPIISDPFHCGPSFPLPHLRAPHRLPRVHGPSGQPITELNFKEKSC